MNKIKKKKRNKKVKIKNKKAKIKFKQIKRNKLVWKIRMNGILIAIQKKKTIRKK